MSDLFQLAGAKRHDPAVEAWFMAEQDQIRRLARPWFERMLACGEDVTQVLQDGHPTACLGNAAFAYVGAFKSHANIGFFHGAALEDPAGLLEGSGKRMRHVKLRWGQPAPTADLEDLIVAACHDIRLRIAAAEHSP